MRLVKFTVASVTHVYASHERVDPEYSTWINIDNIDEVNESPGGGCSVRTHGKWTEITASADSVIELLNEPQL